MNAWWLIGLATLIWFSGFVFVILSQFRELAEEIVKTLEQRRQRL